MNNEITYQVTDPAKAAHDTQNWQGDLYHAAQLALRAVVSGLGVEALLNQRLEIGAQLLARVLPWWKTRKWTISWPLLSAKSECLLTPR